MNLSQYALEQLVSSEILQEIQSSFITKQDIAVCIYNSKNTPLLPFPASHPALRNISDNQRALFELFFSPAALNLDMSTLALQPLSRSFGRGAVSLSAIPLQFENKLMGFAILAQFSKIIDPEKNKILLQTLESVAEHRLSLSKFQDKDISTAMEKLKISGQKLQDLMQLFFEAGRARAQVGANKSPVKSDSTTQTSDGEIGILFCAPDGQIVEATQRVPGFLGYNDAGELCDLNFFDDLLVNDSDRGKIRALLQIASQAKESTEFKCKDGSSIPLYIKIYHLDTQSTMFGFECHLSTFDKEQEQIEVKITRKFVPILSHDEKRLTELQSEYTVINNQIGRVITEIEQKVDALYGMNVQDSKLYKAVADVKKLAVLLSGIRQQLAYFALKEAPNRNHIDLNRLVANIAKNLKKFLSEPISIQTILEPSNPFALIDQDLFVHAIGSVCKNAIDAMPKGGTLILETRATEREVKLIISDSGAGFLEAHERKLFEPFYSTKDRVGAGLGLAAAYGIIKSHGGTLSIAHSPGDGVRVTISLPVTRNDQSPETGKERGARAVVLIIDDEQDIAEATAMTLRRSGYTVFTSASCREAFLLIEEIGDTLKLIILDNQLGNTKGKDCAQDVLEKLPNVRILFYSGADDDFELMSFIQKVGAGWLKKPFSSQELVAKTNSLLTKRK